MHRYRRCYLLASFAVPPKSMAIISQSIDPHAYALKLEFRKFDKQNKHVTKATLISARTLTRTPISSDSNPESMAAVCTRCTGSIQWSHSKASTTHSMIDEYNLGTCVEPHRRRAAYTLFAHYLKTWNLISGNKSARSKVEMFKYSRQFTNATQFQWGKRKSIKLPHIWNDGAALSLCLYAGHARILSANTNCCNNNNFS